MLEDKWIIINYKVQGKEIVDPVAEKIFASQVGDNIQYTLRGDTAWSICFILKQKKKSPILGVQIWSFTSPKSHAYKI